MPLAQNVPPWPDWTAITTEWNGPYPPDGEDPDEYTGTCYRCQEANRTPNVVNGTQADCIEWAYGHADDPDPTPPPPPPPPPHGGGGKGGGRP